MALRTTTVTVTTTAARLAALDETDYPSRDLVVHNPGPATIWVGAANVTPDSGVPIPAGGDLAFDGILPADIPYAVTNTGSTTVRVLEVGV